MAAFAAEMWRLVAPGGILAITTWGPGLFEPANSHFWDAVGEIEPTLVRAFNPWDEITTEAALARLFARASVPHPAIICSRLAMPLAVAEFHCGRVADGLRGHAIW